MKCRQDGDEIGDAAMRDAHSRVKGTGWIELYSLCSLLGFYDD